MQCNIKKYYFQLLQIRMNFNCKLYYHLNYVKSSTYGEFYLKKLLIINCKIEWICESLIARWSEF